MDGWWSRTQYTALGEEVPVSIGALSVPVKEKFTGKELDGELGLEWYHFPARNYDPEVGVWTTPDPKEQFWGAYSYTGNGFNPVGSVDPDGREPLSSYAYSAADNELEQGHIWRGYGLTAVGVLVQVLGPDATFDNYNRAMKGENVTLGQAMLGLLDLPGLNQADEAAKLAAKAAEKAATKSAAGATKVGDFTLTRTVANHIEDVSKAGVPVRPYSTSPLTIQEIISTGKGVPDATLPNALRYDVPGAFNGSQGTWQLVTDPATNTIFHFNFVSP